MRKKKNDLAIETEQEEVYPQDLVVSVDELEVLIDNYNLQELGRFWLNGVENVVLKLISKKDKIDA